MKKRRLRFSIRTQLTIIVMLAALLGTGATLFVADFTIQTDLQGQLMTQASQDINIAWLIMRSIYGSQISVNAQSQLIAQAPQGVQANSASRGLVTLNGNFDYVDQVEQLIGGAVTIYQCAGPTGPSLPCRVAATDIPGANIGNNTPGQTITFNAPLDPAINRIIAHQQDTYVSMDPSSILAYSPITDSHGRFIGVLSVAVPLSNVQSLVTNNTWHLAAAESVVMLFSIIVALIIAGAITRELQRAAREVASSSDSFSSISTQQASGSSQQVWAINAINHALINLGETTAQITQRTKQLAQTSASVLAHRETLTVRQLNGFIAYISRSLHDISIMSATQAKTYTRMSSAMQAVTEVAEQVARDSQETAENAQRLEDVVHALQRLVGTGSSLYTPISASPSPSRRETTLMGGDPSPQDAEASANLQVPRSSTLPAVGRPITPSGEG